MRISFNFDGTDGNINVVKIKGLRQAGLYGNIKTKV